MVFNNEIFNPIACIVQEKKVAHNEESKFACQLIIILGDRLLPLLPQTI